MRPWSTPGPSTNVDLMYYVNLDGELTNQYVTNTEAPWAQREWVQVNFDKNDMSDIAPLGEYQWNLLSNCVDAYNVSTTLVPGSFNVDEANNYMEWTVSITLPLIWSGLSTVAASEQAAQACVFAYGDLGQQAIALGKESVTLELKYSLMRTLPMDQVTYQPMVIAEKDGIHHKYGFYPNITENLDPVTGMVGFGGAGDPATTRRSPSTGTSRRASTPATSTSSRIPASASWTAPTPCWKPRAPRRESTSMNTTTSRS